MSEEYKILQNLARIRKDYSLVTDKDIHTFTENAMSEIQDLLALKGILWENYSFAESLVG